MKNILKRVSALLIAAIMMIAMCVPVMAAANTPTADQVKTALTGTIPSSDDKATVYIRGFEDQNVTITAYQIVKANYYTATDAQSGFAGYEICYTGHADETLFKVASDTTAEGKPIYVANYPTSAQLNLLSGVKGTNGVTVSKGITTFTKEGDTYTASADLAIGEWMVIVEDNDGNYVYNPMVVSTYYVDNGTKIAINKIDITDSWNWTDHDVALATTNAYVKSTKPNPSKKITDSDIASKDSAEHGNDTAIGKTVSFEIDATIPSYSEEYYTYTTTENGKTITKEKTTENAVIFWVEDELDKGLTLNRENGKISVKVNGTELATSNYTITYTPKTAAEGTADSFKIALTKDYLKTLAGKPATERAIVVTYEATVNKYATTNFDPNKNTMMVTYNNKPDNGTENIDNLNQKKEKDTTYHYTFEIDGKIAGTGTGVKYDKTTHELIKIDETGEAVVEKTFVEGISEEYEVSQAVQGAIFKLTGTDGDGKDAVFYAMTDENGYFVAAPASAASTSYTLADNTSITGADIKGFKQMDVGTYTLKEVKAPEGFSLDAKEHTVVITAEYYSEDQYTGEDSNKVLTAHKGELKSYEIKIDGEQTSTYEATYNAGVVEEVENLTEGEVETTYIKNTRIPALPSTGGMGSYLFTIIGVAVMAVVAASFFRSRTKKA